jgi:L-cysteine desulfidase
MQNTVNDTLLKVLAKELIVSMGCTEPAAATLAGAKAASALRQEFGLEPQKIFINASRDVIKNAMSVGLPNSSLRGLKAAVVLGALGGNPEAGLAVLATIAPEAEIHARKLLERGQVELLLQENVPPVFIKATVCSSDHEATAIIAHFHDRLESLLVDGQERLSFAKEGLGPLQQQESTNLFPGGYPTFAQMIAFADTVDLDAIAFLVEAAKINMKVSDHSFTEHYGIEVGRQACRFSENRIAIIEAMSMATAKAAAASDARMAGCAYPVVINSGSGNQGITVTVPIAILAEKLGASDESLARALALSSIVAITIASKKERLSALCGVFTAAIGTTCGFVRLLGGKEKEINLAVNSMVGNLTGMICDGAKGTCALKIHSAVNAAALSALMAMEGKGAPADTGIVGADADASINNVERLARDGMRVTDRVILDILMAQ